MNKTSLEKYRRRLRQSDSELQTMLERNKVALRSNDDAVPEDMAGQASNSSAKDFFLSQSDNEQAQLLLIRSALQRLETGSFGYCESCGEKIDRKRLDAVPWAPYCMSCQEEEERQNGNGRYS